MSTKILTVGYSTLAERIENISQPEIGIPHEIFISIQNPKGVDFSLPTKFQFQSVTSNEKGVAKSRNNPACDLVLAQAIDTNGQLRKTYPSKEVALTKFNSAKAATYEMIVRVDSARSKGVSFDESFGAGVENFLGDEYIFITDLLKKGGKAVFLPVTIAIHPEESSGSRWGTESDMRARAQVFTRVFGLYAPLIRTIFFLKNYRNFGGFKNISRFAKGKF